MEAIIGEVTALDKRTKTLTVSVEPGKGGRTEDLEVPWSENTVVKSKRKTQRPSKAERIKRGMNVIVQLQGPGAPHTRYGTPRRSDRS